MHIKGSNGVKIKLTAVSTFHYFRLFYRSLLLLLVIIWYIFERLEGGVITLSGSMDTPLHYAVWAIFMVEIIMRFFPNKLESPGCQKQYGRNYEPTGRTDVKLHDNNAVMIVAIIWISMNGAIGALYMLDVIDAGVMMLISLVYSVCDMICILFFCPFQTWILKNRCCSSCRIYNWDYAMMFTPLFFVPGIFTWSLLIASMLLLIRWEFTIWRSPERFSENTNAYLACANCTEKLCMHKKQLIGFRAQLNEYTDKQIRRILSKIDKNK